MWFSEDIHAITYKDSPLLCGECREKLEKINCPKYPAGTFEPRPGDSRQTMEEGLARCVKKGCPRRDVPITWQFEKEESVHAN